MIKNKKILSLLLSIVIIVMFQLQVYAITSPHLNISSNDYQIGDKMDLDEVNRVKVGTTLQLYAMLAHGNDLSFPGENNLGWYVNETNLNGVNWSSSDTSIATVDNTGKVSGIKEGTATITANYHSGDSQDEKIATKEIEVIKQDKITIELTTDKNNCNVNETFTATVNWNKEMQATDFKLSYDATKLSLTSASIEDKFYAISKDTTEENCNVITVAWISLVEQVEDEIKLKNISFTFKAIQKGETQIKIVDVESLADENLNIPDEIDYTTKGTKTITIRMLGDVNLDGVIDDKDLTELNRYITDNVNLEGEVLTNADLNMDGIVDEIDVAILRYYLANTSCHLPFIYGDIDGDDKVTSKDVILLTRHLSDEIEFTLNEEQLMKADVNLDGLVNEYDFNIFRKVIVNVITDLPLRLISNKNIKTNVLNDIATISGFESEHISVNNLLTNFNSEYGFKVYDINENKIENDTIVGTGTIARGQYGEYHVVIYGDTNGDGEINAVDALGIVKNKLNILNFSNAIYEQAGRVTKSTRENKTTPSSVDALAIVKHKLDIQKIEQ